MKAPDESGVNKDFPEKNVEWIATAGKKKRRTTFRIPLLLIARKNCPLVLLGGIQLALKSLVGRRCA